MTAVVLNMNDIYRKEMNDANAQDLSVVTIKAMIVTNSFTPNQNTDEFITAADANEVSGTGYTAGGNTCANGTVTMNGSGLVTVDCDDPASYAQNGAGFSNGRYVLLYIDTGTPATSRIIATSAAFASDQGNVAGAFTTTINAAGIFTMAR